jgi:hypothetical protein
MPFESDPIAHKLNELVSSQCLYVDVRYFKEMNLAEQAVSGTWTLANEVYNGGFMQYFRNTSGEHAREMAATLRAIDADLVAHIVESAIDLIGPGTPWGDEPNYFAAMESTPEDVNERIRQLERQLYDELDDLHLKVFRYLSKHRDQIEAPADFWNDKALP